MRVPDRPSSRSPRPRADPPLTGSRSISRSTAAGRPHPAPLEGCRPRCRRDRPDAHPGRGPRAGRGVGERQDDDRKGRRQADQADGRQAEFEGPDVSHLWGPGRSGTTTAGSRSSSRIRTRRSTRSSRSSISLRSRSWSTASRPTRSATRPSCRARGSRTSARRGLRRPLPHELSGGQRQRVVIAGALVMDPEVIVADEPVSMLDVSIRTELLRLMLDLRVERGLTYLFITHDLSLAWVIADRIAVMYLGKIMEIGPAEAVIRSPRNPYTKALVSVSPSPIRPTPGPGPSGRSSRAKRRTRPTSRPAADSIRAARSPSTGARSRSRHCSTWAGDNRPHAGWPSRAVGRKIASGGARMTGSDPGVTADVAALRRPGSPTFWPLRPRPSSPSSSPSATRAAGGPSPASGVPTSAPATSSRPSGVGSPGASGVIRRAAEQAGVARGLGPAGRRGGPSR